MEIINVLEMFRNSLKNTYRKQHITNDLTGKGGGQPPKLETRFHPTSAPQKTFTSQRAERKAAKLLWFTSGHGGSEEYLDSRKNGVSWKKALVVSRFGDKVESIINKLRILLILRMESPEDLSCPKRGYILEHDGVQSLIETQLISK